MQVNAWAHVELLRAALTSRTSAKFATNDQQNALPVVVVSSDVVGGSLPATLVYAATKAAVEETFRHAAADLAPPGIALLIVRLPDIGVPMRSALRAPTPASGR